MKTVVALFPFLTFVLASSLLPALSASPYATRNDNVQLRLQQQRQQGYPDLSLLVESAVQNLLTLSAGPAKMSSRRSLFINRGRSLQQRATTPDSRQCVWTTYSGDFPDSDEEDGCELNFEEYVTTLPGKPMTSTQKLLALQAGMSWTCMNRTTSKTCRNSSTTEHCYWDVVNGGCFLDDDFIEPQWLLGRIYCPGSPMDDVMSCASLSPAPDSCVGNLAAHNCTWKPPSIRNYLTTLLQGLAAQASGSSSIDCVPVWATDTAFVADLVDTAHNASNGYLGNDGISRSFRAVFEVLLGDCQGVQPYVDILGNCSLAAFTSDEAACKSRPECIWSSEAETCAPSDGAMSSTLYYITDPWMASLNLASDQCDALADEAACEGSAVIYPRPARYANFAKQQPEIGGDTTTIGGGGNDAALRKPIAWMPLLSLLLTWLIIINT